MADGDLLEQALRAYPGTVTEFLEGLAGEPIDADKLGDESPGQLAAPDSAPVRSKIRRVVVLRGRRTRRAFVYAESLLTADRVPPEVRADLDTTDHPIGRVLLAHDLGVRRQASPPTRRTPRWEGNELSALIERSPLSRSYRLLIDGEPAIEIDEWFLPAAEDALRQRTANANNGGLPG